MGSASKKPGTKGRKENYMKELPVKVMEEGDNWIELLKEGDLIAEDFHLAEVLIVLKIDKQQKRITLVSVRNKTALHIVRQVRDEKGNRLKTNEIPRTSIYEYQSILETLKILGYDFSEQEVNKFQTNHSGA